MWVRQRGNHFGYKIILAIYQIIGYKGTKGIIWFVSLFYALITTNERKAMKEYYKRVGVPYSFFYYFTHIHQFSLSLFDRFVTKMNPHIFTIAYQNKEAFISDPLPTKSRILALAHVGNWANTFVAFRQTNVTIHAVLDEKLKASIVNYEKSLKHQESVNLHIINANDGLFSSIAIAQAIQSGENVAMMVDRIVDKSKTVEVDFLGTKTKINRNPFEVAYNREIEVIGITVVRTGDKEYKLIFSEAICVSKESDKEAAVTLMANQYAHYLETIIKEYPKQWFNFYNFWEH